MEGPSSQRIESRVLVAITVSGYRSKSYSIRRRCLCISADLGSISYPLDVTVGHLRRSPIWDELVCLVFIRQVTCSCLVLKSSMNSLSLILPVELTYCLELHGDGFPFLLHTIYV